MGDLDIYPLSRQSHGIGIQFSRASTAARPVGDVNLGAAGSEPSTVGVIRGAEL